MLDKLPLELLDEVLDQLPLLPPLRWNEPGGRTDTLLACCLVSKRIHSRAILHLWREVRFHVQEEIPEFVKRVEQAVPPLSKALVRSLQVQVLSETRTPWQQTLAVVRQFSSMQNFDLEAFGEDVFVVDLQMLSTSFPLLAILRLAEVVVAPLSVDTVFPHLLCLTLHHLAHTRSSLSSLPSVKNCPRLRALVLNISDANTDASLLNSFHHDLAHQLDMLQIDGASCLNHPILHSPVEILLTVEIADLVDDLAVTIAPRHLRIWMEDDYALETQSLVVLSRLLDTSSRSFRLPVHLEWACEQSNPEEDELEPWQVYYDLCRRCAALGVEFSLYGAEEEGQYDLWPWFTRPSIARSRRSG